MEKLCIGCISLQKHMPKYIKSMSNKNKFTCSCETFIITMLLESGLNKFSLSQLAKFDKVYNNSESTIILQ